MSSGTMLARLSILAAAGSVLGACGGGGGDSASKSSSGDSAAMAAPPAAPAAAPAAGGEGGQVFASTGNCYTCHGPGGVGTTLAPNLTDAEWTNFPSRPTVDQVAGLVRTGVPQPKQHPAPMPPMGGGQLTDKQVQSVAQYVLSLSGG